MDKQHDSSSEDNEDSGSLNVQHNEDSGNLMVQDNEDSESLNVPDNEDLIRLNNLQEMEDSESRNIQDNEDSGSLNVQDTKDSGSFVQVQECSIGMGGFRVFRIEGRKRKYVNVSTVPRRIYLYDPDTSSSESEKISPDSPEPTLTSMALRQASRSTQITTPERNQPSTSAMEIEEIAPPLFQLHITQSEETESPAREEVGEPPNVFAEGQEDEENVLTRSFRKARILPGDTHVPEPEVPTTDHSPPKRMKKGSDSSEEEDDL